jgi:hypothetical protein
MPSRRLTPVLRVPDLYQKGAPPPSDACHVTDQSHTGMDSCLGIIMLRCHVRIIPSMSNRIVR